LLLLFIAHLAIITTILECRRKKRCVFK